MQIRNSGSEGCRESLDQSPGGDADAIFAKVEAQRFTGHFVGLMNGPDRRTLNL